MWFFEFCLQQDPSPEEKARLLKHGSDFKTFFPIIPLNHSCPIHVFIQMVFCAESHKPVPSVSLLRFLHDCGVDFNQKDEMNKTPLYTVLWNDAHPKTEELIKDLLTFGAHPGYLGVEGGIPGFMKNDSLKGFLRPFYPLPLKFLAAYVIIQMDIHYKPQLPDKLCRFIESINTDNCPPFIDAWKLPR